MTVSKRQRPPRVAGWLLRRLLDAQAHESLLGDLEESFARTVATGSRRAAVGRYWREALGAIVAFGLRAPRSSSKYGTGGGSGDGHEARTRALFTDFRYGARVLWRAPTFTVACVLTLGLAIGATTAIFSVVNPVLLQPLPYPQPDRLVMVWERDQGNQSVRTGFATIVDVGSASKSLERFAAMGGWNPTTFAEGEAERVEGQRVSWAYFGLLGVRPAIGRDFVAEEDVPGSRVVMLGHGLWRRRFSGDSSIVGRTIDLDGTAHLVIGVMPSDFENVVAPRSEIWRVLGYAMTQEWACRTCRHLRMIGRLKPEVSLEAARAELDGISSALVAAYPREYMAAGMGVYPLADEVAAPVRSVLLIVLGAVGLVLLIAAANVISLQLGRALRREQEFVIRAALGANRGQLVRQLMAEGLVLSSAGAAVGVLGALLVLPAIRARLPESLPRLSAVGLDIWTLLLVTSLAVVIGMLIGLVPAVRTGSRRHVLAAGAGRRVTAARHPTRALLVVIEVAVALMLLIGAGLLSRSLLLLLSVDGGFDPAHTLTLEVQATGAGYREVEAIRNHYDRIVEAVEAVPGVVAAGVSSQLPLGGNFDRYGIQAQDKPLETAERAPSADRYVVTRDFLAALRIGVLRGRPLRSIDDRENAAPVALVSASLAARLWPGEDPIGKRIRLGDPDGPWREVVGVAADVRHHGLDSSLLHQVYMPQRQWPWADNIVALAVRTAGDPEVLAPAIRRAVRSVDPSQPIVRVATMEQVVAASTARRQLALVVFAAFAAIAALLAGAGIYGVLSGSVTERTREVGVRTALGATPPQIIALVLRQAGALAGTGVLLGLGGALALSRYLESLLYEVQPADPPTLIGVALAIAMIAMVACAAPAVRAARIDPMRALREE